MHTHVEVLPVEARPQDASHQPRLLPREFTKRMTEKERRRRASVAALLSVSVVLGLAIAISLAF